MQNGNERFYTELTKACETLRERAELREHVEEWWQKEGWGLPPHHHLTDKPMAGFCRQLATARYEDIVFSKLAERAGLMPVWLEYLGDKIYLNNRYKKSLVVRHLVRGRGKRGGLRLDRQPLTDTCLVGGARINEVQLASAYTNNRTLTDINTSLVEFHHRLQDMMLANPQRVDITNWLKSIGHGRAVDYYAASMSLFVAHGVLFEDYHGGESGVTLDDFTTRVFEPAYAKVERLFGGGPVIVRMPWQPGFAYYPATRELAISEVAFSL